MVNNDKQMYGQMTLDFQKNEYRMLESMSL